MEFLFCTTNTHKLKLAQMAAKDFGFTINQLAIEVDEIQSEDPQSILEHKVRTVHDKVQKPLIVTDDSWNIPAVNGFPGPYMKSANHWFTSNDWLNLMAKHSDKRIFLERRLAFMDGTELVTFNDVRERVFLNAVSPRDGVSILRVIALETDGKPINEIWIDSPEILESGDSVWTKFFKWYEARP